MPEVWMIADPKRGCPRSHTVVIPNSDGAGDDEPRVSYNFVVNRSTTVAEEHVEAVMGTVLLDKHNYQIRPFTLTPPERELNDADKMRVALEHQQDQIEQMQGLIQSLVAGNPELAEKLMRPEQKPDLLKGIGG